MYASDQEVITNHELPIAPDTVDEVRQFGAGRQRCAIFRSARYSSFSADSSFGNDARVLITLPASCAAIPLRWLYKWPSGSLPGKQTAG